MRESDLSHGLGASQLAPSRRCNVNRIGAASVLASFEISQRCGRRRQAIPEVSDLALVVPLLALQLGGEIGGALRGGCSVLALAMRLAPQPGEASLSIAFHLGLSP